MRSHLRSGASWAIFATTMGLSACASQGSSPASRPALGDEGAATSREPHQPYLALPPAARLSTTGQGGERVDPIPSLQALLNAGDVVFTYDSLTGYLPALLSALDIPISTQGLVFSRTSLQTDRITPWTPRALYFNDDIYIGFVQDSPMLEVASIDPDDGAVFYTLHQDADAPPQFRKQGSVCLGCHNSTDMTAGVPGVMVRSTLTDRHGYAVASLHEGPTTDATPFEQRYAGWYITGTHGAPGPAGNVLGTELHADVSDPEAYLRSVDMNHAGNLTSLRGRFDTSLYLSDQSDLVALLVLTHQTRVHNMITLAHTTTEAALKDQLAVVVTTGADVSEGELFPATQVRIDAMADRLVRELMFTREAPLPGPIHGTSGFAEEFMARGPTDPAGRSLRDFDLDTHLFTYGLSFLIYTDAFDALPPLMKNRVYERIEAALDGSAESGDFDHLSPAVRTATREILIATKPDYAAWVDRRESSATPG